jgi:hypothetical protein
MDGGPYTELPSDCSEYSHKRKRCSRGIASCPCPLFHELSYANPNRPLREWLDRATEVARQDGMFDPDPAHVMLEPGPKALNPRTREEAQRLNELIKSGHLPPP